MDKKTYSKEKYYRHWRLFSISVISVIGYFFSLLLFIPGAFLLHLLSSKYKLQLSKLEILVLGSASWSFLLAGCGYTVGILSHSIREFFLVFAILSMSLLACGGYYLVRHKKQVRIHLKVSSDNLLILFLLVPFLVLIFTLTLTHSTFIEYDAIFLYFPTAKSIVETGGLQYSLYHQTNLLSTVSPAMPIMYAWLSYLNGNWIDFNLAVRILPFVYIMLTSAVVYLISKQVSDNSTTAKIAALCFLSIPGTFAIASNYSLYLDIPFTFLLALNLFIFLRILSKEENHKFWWLMLGIATSFMLLEKDMSFLILPSLIAILLIPALQQFDKKSRVLLGLMISILFMGAYNFFFVWDLYHFPADMMTGLVVRQFPVFIIIAIFSLLICRLPKNEHNMVKMKPFLLFSLPFMPVVLFLLRNLVSFGAISSSLFFFNADFKAATALMNQAVAAKTLPIIFYETLRWDILFTSLNLGAILLIPVALGLSAIVYLFINKQIDPKKHFVLVSFFLMLLSLWSWAFYCSYQGPELRRLYYFTPLFAIFAAIGIHTVIEHTKSRNIVPRFIMFNSLVFVYLWAFKFNIGSSNTAQLRSTLVSLKIADIETLLVLAFFFLLSFYPLNINFQTTNIEKYLKTISDNIRLIIPLTLIILLSSLTLPFSFNMLSNSQENIKYVPPYWENGLDEVISYIDLEVKDNYSIVTCYALPIAYFTNHPVIEVTRYDGIITLLQLNESSPEILDTLREQNIGYLLFPKPGHSHYNYFKNLSKDLPILSTEFISKNPNILLLKEFSQYRLYKILTSEEVSNAYKYLTSFKTGWTPLNNYTLISNSIEGFSIHSNSTPLEVIADDHQEAFWVTGKADPKDEITISDDFQTKLIGADSLKIQVNGAKNMVIDHSFSTYQNYSSLSTFSMYLYGANTNKSITITFHTARWADYYSRSIKDNFTCWKKISLSLGEFYVTGKPSWSKITYIEILLGSRTATYYIDQISLGYPIGLQEQLSPIATDSSQIQMVVSVQGHKLQHPAEISLVSVNEVITQNLIDGVNLIDIPSDLLDEGGTLKIFYSPVNTEEELDLYYLAFLQP